MNNVFRNETWRILTNYARLIAGLAIGLTVTRLLLGVSEIIFGIYTLITVGFGISIMLTELLRMGVVPVLGEETLSGRVVNPVRFREKLLTALLVSGGFALLGGVIMILLGVWLIPRVGDPDLVGAAWLFLWFRVAMMLVTVTLMPFMNVLLVTGRFAQYNLFLFLERLSELLAIALAIWFVPQQLPADAANHLVLIGALMLVLNTLTFFACMFYVVSLGADHRPQRNLPGWNVTNEILGRIGWSSLQTISMNLYLRFDVILVAIAFGPTGTVAFGVAIRLMGYVRAVTLGLVSGLESVFSNLIGLSRRGEAANDDELPLRVALIKMTTALQASFVFQGSVFILLLRDDLVALWLGPVLDPSGTNNMLREISDISLLMVVGMGMRSLTLGWMAAMTGMGLAHRFTPLLLPGAIVNLVLLGGLYLAAPEHLTVMVVAWVFLATQIVTHGLVLPPIAARVLQIHLGELLWVMVPILSIAILSAAGGYLALRLVGDHSVLLRVGTVAAIMVLGLIAGLVPALVNFKRMELS